MGSFCSSCFKGEDTALITPDAEIRRRQMAEAAERRVQENQTRGIKNPESIRRAEQRQKEMDDLERQQALSGNTALKWQAN